MIVFPGGIWCKLMWLSDVFDVAAYALMNAEFLIIAELFINIIASDYAPLAYARRVRCFYFRVHNHPNETSVRSKHKFLFENSQIENEIRHKNFEDQWFYRMSTSL